MHNNNSIITSLLNTVTVIFVSLGAPWQQMFIQTIVVKDNMAIILLIGFSC